MIAPLACDESIGVPWWPLSPLRACDTPEQYGGRISQAASDAENGARHHQSIARQASARFGGQRCRGTRLPDQSGREFRARQGRYSDRAQGQTTVLREHHSRAIPQACWHAIPGTSARAMKDLFRLLEQSRARTFRDRLQPDAGAPALAAVQARLPADALLLEYWVGSPGMALLWVSQRCRRRRHARRVARRCAGHPAAVRCGRAEGLGLAAGVRRRGRDPARGSAAALARPAPADRP